MDHQPGPGGVVEPVTQSRQLPDVAAANRLGQLGLEGQDSAVGEVGDKVDLVVAAGRAHPVALATPAA